MNLYITGTFIIISHSSSCSPGEKPVTGYPVQPGFQFQCSGLSPDNYKSPFISRRLKTSDNIALIKQNTSQRQAIISLLYGVYRTFIANKFSLALQRNYRSFAAEPSRLFCSGTIRCFKRKIRCE